MFIHFIFIGLEPPTLTLDPVMKFCVAALEHASGPVREEASKVIFQVYRLAGTPVKSYLPADDQRTRKNPLYRYVLCVDLGCWDFINFIPSVVPLATACFTCTANR